jgi:hypothetical protein
MPDRVKKRLESLEQLRAELERVRAQADELHDRVIHELHRVELDVGSGRIKTKRPPRATR